MFRIICIRCKKLHIPRVSPLIPCKNCIESKTYQKELRLKKTHFDKNIKPYLPEHKGEGGRVHAIWTDDKGAIVKTNKKGDIITSSDYDRDSRGWKMAGKKIAKTDNLGNKIYQ